MMKWGSLTAAVFCAGILLGISFSAVHAEDSVEVLCYALDEDDYEYVDNVDTFDARKGAKLCNDLYEDCNEECIGCILDGGVETCVDGEGRPVQR